MNPIAYIRVSTGEQGDSGLGLDAQREAIRQWWRLRGNGERWPTFREDQASGKNADRPGLQACLALLAAKETDTLIVAKLDRLGRSLLDLVTILEASRKQGWTLVALDIGLDTSTPAGEAMFGMMAVWAQLERRMISARTKDALRQAKLNGTKSGKPIGRPCTLDPLVRSGAKFLRTAKGWSYPKIAAELGLANWTTARRICESEQ